MKNKFKYLTAIIIFWMITLSAMATTSQVGGVAVSSTTNAFTFGAGTTSVTFNTSGTGATISQSGINVQQSGTMVASGTIPANTNYAVVGTTNSINITLPTSGTAVTSYQKYYVVMTGSGGVVGNVTAVTQTADTFITGGTTYNILPVLNAVVSFSANSNGVWIPEVANINPSIRLKTISSSPYTVLTTDNGSVLLMTGSTTLVAPALNAGFNVGVLQTGTLQTIISGYAGITVTNQTGDTKTAGQWATATLLYTTGTTAVWCGNTSN